MGDSMKINKDKRHRSYSSLASAPLQDTRSERLLDINGSINEVDDQFAKAAAGCDELQEKIDLLKCLKRKKKLRKRSMTKVAEHSSASGTGAIISVRTLPKKNVNSQQTVTGRRHKVSPCPSRGATDTGALEQRVAGRGSYSTLPQQSNQTLNKSLEQTKKYLKIGPHRIFRHHAEGDKISYQNNEALRGDDINQEQSPVQKNSEGHSTKTKLFPNRQPSNFAKNAAIEERPVVELFNKNYTSKSCVSNSNSNTLPDLMSHKSRKVSIVSRPNEEMLLSEPTKKIRRTKCRSRRYELPTVASQMKQAGVRYYYSAVNHTNIPFVVSKSTAPSHNIGVNIQQVLNGFKTQQPLSGIPMTIAHHMGLGHIPMNTRTDKMRTLSQIDCGEINAIKMGQQMVRLPSYNKSMSFNRLLTMYREGDGMVSRFLKAISRPHYFYTAMFNLGASNDVDGGTSKGRVITPDTKHNLSEFAALYREFENINKCINEGATDPEILNRREELTKDLAAREQGIRRVMQNYRSMTDENHRCQSQAKV